MKKMVFVAPLILILMLAACTGDVTDQSGGNGATAAELTALQTEMQELKDEMQRLESDSPNEMTSLLHVEQGYAPVMGSVFDSNVGLSKGYYVAEIQDGLYWATTGTYQIMFLTTGEGVIVVDAPPSFGENILSAISDVTDEPITHVIYSHFHGDHIGGAHVFPDDVIVIAHEDTAAQLERSLPCHQCSGPRPMPDITFSDNYRLEVGNQVIELEYKGPNHTEGNIFIYAPKQNVLMVVDIIFPGWGPFMAVTDDFPGLIAAHDQILSYDIDTLIAGHLTRLGTREDVVIQKEFVQDLVEAAAKSNLELFATIFSSAFEDAVAIGSGNNPWVPGKIAFDRGAQQCVDEILPKWTDRLAGVDVWMFENCWTMAMSLRID